MISKIGLAVIKNNKLLVLKKKGLDKYILPGGKVEKGESDIECLEREIDEELQAFVTNIKFLATFTDIAAGSDEKLQIKLYLGDISKFQVSSEIEAYYWVAKNDLKNLSPIIKNKIIPFLKNSNFLN